MARTTTKKTEPETTEISAEVAPVSAYNSQELKNLTSFDEAVRLATAAHGVVQEAADELGNGFSIAKDEDLMRLIGKPMLFLEWSVRNGDFGRYVSIMAVVAGEQGAPAAKWIINDGSTGIFRQLMDYQADTGKTGGLLVRHGLRVSEYPTCAEKNHEHYGKPLNRDEEVDHYGDNLKVGKGRTYYLDTSK